MILREWRGRTTTARSTEYPRHFREIVVPELRSVSGFLGASLNERREGEHVEFVVLTRWTSWDAIRAFAGADPDRAMVEPGAIAALTDYDRTVRHYEVLESIAVE